ncbi:hypothetical protein V8C40DRAFT_236740 [Trichoderma camerunense]
MDIQVLRKAAFVCLRCRTHKQRCDRNLPKCGRCASKLTRCQYPTFLAAGHSRSSDERADGPQRQYFTLEKRRIVSLGNLVPLVTELLLEKSLTTAQLIDNYSNRVHEWFPVVDLTQLRSDVTFLTSFEALDSCTLFLMSAMLLPLTASQSENDDQTRPMQLYRTLKVMLSGGQFSLPEFSQCLVQMQALIALYECMKGMYYQARLTLSSVTAMMDLKRTMRMERRISLQMCLNLVLLDRILMLATVDHDVPTIISPSSAICKAIQLYLDESQAPNDPAMVADPMHALYVMSKVVLVTGRVLHFVYCSNNALRCEETYECLEFFMRDTTKSLIESKGSHSLVYCNAISLSLCCLVVLHQTRTSQESLPQGNRDLMALQTSRSLVWDTFKLSSEVLMTIDVYNVSFFSIFFQLRGVYDAIQEGWLSQLSQEDEKGLLKTLRQLSKRWLISGELNPSTKSYLAG